MGAIRELQLENMYDYLSKAHGAIVGHPDEIRLEVVKKHYNKAKGWYDAIRNPEIKNMLEPCFNNIEISIKEVEEAQQ